MKQIFEHCPSAETLENIVDLLRYENSSQKRVISKHEQTIQKLTESLENAENKLEKLQHVVDMQAAELLSARRNDRT
ncbi:hypothetical protein [Ruegeria sp. HKCCA4633]|uniref:hypothetical protein n=1 Tax=Ruegeria sp. HKCCA4633 TaxID=2682983 RepID=UPI0014878134|nr:hypothetical protein [Ruegeria sp. HKCCA4633]